MNTAKTINGDSGAGDWVISNGSSDYRYLIGQVREVVKQGTPEHRRETTNDTDSVHVDFTVFDYPPERIQEIEERFSDLYGEPKTFDELPLDDVIMAPDMLVRISHLGKDEIKRMGDLRENCEAFCNCFAKPKPQSKEHAELIERVDKNLRDYHASLLAFGKREIIDMAGKIAAMSDAHSYMTHWHRFDAEELDFYLQFQNPLEIVADEWHERKTDLDDMSYTMDAINEYREDYLGDNYPMISDLNVAADNTLPDERNQSETDLTSVQTDKPEKSPMPQKTQTKPGLFEKLREADEKVKAQESLGNNNHSTKKKERE